MNIGDLVRDKTSYDDNKYLEVVEKQVKYKSRYERLKDIAVGISLQGGLLGLIVPLLANRFIHGKNIYLCCFTYTILSALISSIVLYFSEKNRKEYVKYSNIAFEESLKMFKGSWKKNVKKIE